MLAAGEAGDFIRKSRGRKRAAGEDGDAVFRVEGSELLANYADVRFSFNRCVDEPRELDAIDGEGMSGGNGAGIGALQQRRSGTAHLLLEQPRRGVLALGLQRIRADQLA